MATSATNIYTINRATLLSSKVNLFPAKIETFLWLDNLNLLDNDTTGTLFGL